MSPTPCISGRAGVITQLSDPPIHLLTLLTRELPKDPPGTTLSWLNIPALKHVAHSLADLLGLNAPFVQRLYHLAAPWL